MSGVTSTSSPAPAGGPVLGGDVGRVSDSKGRATPKGASFGSVMAAARPILKGAEAVASVLPGGPLISAAVRAPSALARGAGAAGMTGMPPMSGPMASSTSGGGASGMPITTHTPTMPSIDGAGATGSVSGAAGSTGGAGIESVLADSQAFNLYYLQLQEEISAENRGYSALSNVLKARHDTVKNAIGNIR